MIAARIINHPGGGKGIPRWAKGGGGNDGFTTKADAASLLNVTVPQVRKAKVVLDHGTPEQIAAIDRGEAKVGEAYTAEQLRQREEKAAAAALIRAPRLSEHFAEIRAWIKALPTAETKRASVGERIMAVRDFAHALAVPYTLKAND
jgi:hypothetical protein